MILTHLVLFNFLNGASPVAGSTPMLVQWLGRRGFTMNASPGFQRLS